MRAVVVVLRDDAPEWALIDIKHSVEMTYGEETTYGEYVAEVTVRDD